jgi:peptidoglycan-associated lipoprotein
MKETNMKLNKFANLLVIGLVLTIAASGCRKKPVGLTNLPGAGTQRVGDGDRAGAIRPPEPVPTESNPFGTPIGTPSNSSDLHKGWKEDAQALKSETVYFDFDSSVIKAGEKPKVAAVADYLKANSAAAVRVEGNCDERGTEEYNRSLGERRALAVREELIRLGIDATRADTISYGKDKPAVPGTGESVWKQNRRDEFIVLTPPK